VEWSAAIGISGEVGASPRERSGKIPHLYPWGSELPPNVNGLPAGNYPGSEASETNWPPAFRVIPDFRDSFARTAPVASFAANPFGIYDLGGNVWEWCSDQYGPYGRGSSNDPTGPANGSDRVTRGNGWGCSPDKTCSSSRRGGNDPSTRLPYLGFRIAMTPR
jgi:formylglycine-generating enzyme required for sulfatase activity